MAVAVVATSIALATPGAVQARGPADEEPWGTFHIAPAAGVAGTVIHVIGYCGDMKEPLDGSGPVEPLAYAMLKGPGAGGDVIAEASVPLLPYDKPYQLFGTTLTVPAGTPDGIYRVRAGCSFSVSSSTFAGVSLYPYEGRPFHIPGGWGSVFQPAILALDVVTGRALNDVRGSLGVLGFGAEQPSTSTTPTTSPGDVPIPAPSPDGGPKEEPPGITTTSTTRAEQPSPTTTSSPR